MKKILNLIFAILLVASVFAFASCKNNPQPELRKSISEVIFNEDNEIVFFGSTRIYRLKTGEQYYFEIMENDGSGSLGFVNNYNDLIFNIEEVEIIGKDNDSYIFPLKGLKKGSVIIQYDGRINEEESIEESVNYLKILIIFE